MTDEPVLLEEAGLSDEALEYVNAILNYVEAEIAHTLDNLQAPEFLEEGDRLRFQEFLDHLVVNFEFELTP